MVRLVLAGDADELMANEDVWRCNECGNCTAACPMEVDTRAVMTAVRELQRAHGGASCPERRSVEVAHRQLGRTAAHRQHRLRRGHGLPRLVAQGPRRLRRAGHRVGPQPAGQGADAGRRDDRRRPALAGAGAGDRADRRASPTRPLPADAEAQKTEAQPFFAGCALPQDLEAYRLTREVAAGLGLALAETPSAGCCGHPARGTRPTTYRAEGPALTVCPACDAGLREVGQQTRPLWDALTEKARRDGASLAAAAPAFVPYVGCLGERDAALATLGDAAELAGVRDAPLLPVAARLVLRRPGRHVPRPDDRHAAAAGLRRRRPSPRRHHLPALPRQPALRRPPEPAAGERLLLARVLLGAAAARRPDGRNHDREPAHPLASQRTTLMTETQKPHGRKVPVTASRRPTTKPHPADRSSRPAA